jgi:hypothetical protein
LEEHVQLASAKEKEVVIQREAKNKHDAESTKWKALTLEQSNLKQCLLINYWKTKARSFLQSLSKLGS